MQSRSILWPWCQRSRMTKNVYYKGVFFFCTVEAYFLKGNIREVCIITNLNNRTQRQNGNQHSHRSCHRITIFDLPIYSTSVLLKHTAYWVNPVCLFGIQCIVMLYYIMLSYETLCAYIVLINYKSIT